MNEHLFQFIWQFQYFNTNELATVDGVPIFIEHPGALNKGQGPDFTHARIRIGQTLLIGDVELHLKSSEWFRHGHQSDPLYARVVLHVVMNDDALLPVPYVHTLELKSRIRHHLVAQYSEWMTASDPIPCAAQISSLQRIHQLAWLERLGAERMEVKSKNMLAMRHQPEGHWKEICWRELAKAFGSKVNGQSFFEMACRLPLRVLSRHCHQIHQTEALIMGQAGLLEKLFFEHYPVMLQKEYATLKKRYRLKESPYPVLFHPVRPDNFPTVRLAQLAMLMHQHPDLLDTCCEAQNIDAVRTKLKLTANDYWNVHYLFDEVSVFRPKHTGDAFIDHIVINVLVPLLFAMGSERGDPSLKDKALHWMASMEPEKNNVVRLFSRSGCKPDSALHSQAMLQAYSGYCQLLKCLECNIGTQLLRKGNV